MECYLILAILSLIITSNAAPISDEDLDDPGEFGDYFEGDIVLNSAQREAINTAMDVESDETRNGLRDGSKRWPNNTVVYHIVDGDFDEEHLEMIDNGLADIANQSCIKFRKRKNEDEHAVIIQGKQSGCFSNVGLNTPDDDGEVNQVLNLARGCFKHGTVVHEMLHTLGFYHMQSTYDRDDFITIVWENIKKGTEHNFAKYNNDTVTDFGVPYDYDSVMHYPEVAFSKNGNKTIIPKQGSQKGCFSNVGYNSPSEDMEEPRQVLNLAKGCFRHGTIMHEMLHTLGFFHMQSTYNRDDFVTILWENIQTERVRNFVKQNNNTVIDYGVPYDYGSVLHYPATAFSKNGEKTIIPKQKGVAIGQRIKLSGKDVLKLNKMYCDQEEPEVKESMESTKNKNRKLMVVDKKSKLIIKRLLNVNKDFN